MKSRAGLALIAGMAALFAHASMSAQSSDKQNPTVLKDRVITGQAAYPEPKSGWAKTFYFAFTAGPGELVITVRSQSPGRPGGGWAEWRFGTVTNSNFDHSVDDPHDVRYSVTFSEYTSNHRHGAGGGTTARSFPAIGLLAPKSTERREISKRITLPQTTKLIMAVNVSGRFDYRIDLDGPIIGVDSR
jgi:hypothetical protein